LSIAGRQRRISLYDYFEGCDYAYIRGQLDAQVVRERERGGSYALLAEADSQLLQSHDASTHTAGDPCTACGEPWPCPMALSVMAPH
jgi:hypothetical protein